MSCITQKDEAVHMGEFLGQTPGEEQGAGLVPMRKERLENHSWLGRIRMIGQT